MSDEVLFRVRRTRSREASSLAAGAADDEILHRRERRLLLKRAPLQAHNLLYLLTRISSARPSSGVEVLARRQPRVRIRVRLDEQRCSVRVHARISARRVLGEWRADKLDAELGTRRQRRIEAGCTLSRAESRRAVDGVQRRKVYAERRRRGGRWHAPIERNDALMCERKDGLKAKREISALEARAQIRLGRDEIAEKKDRLLVVGLLRIVVGNAVRRPRRQRVGREGAIIEGSGSRNEGVSSPRDAERVHL